MRLLTVTAVALAFAVSGSAATVIPVGEFRSIELRNGGHVVVRHGAVQRVAIVRGGVECSRVRVDGQRLVIDRSHGNCRRGDDKLEVEVVTPHLTSVSVSHGGTIETAGAFPAQASIEATVEQGGTIDIRSIAADDVEASVFSGGRIFTTARDRLAATVRSGGAITYWGDAEDVRRSIRNGGVVSRGR